MLEDTRLRYQRRLKDSGIYTFMAVIFVIGCVGVVLSLLYIIWIELATPIAGKLFFTSVIMMFIGFIFGWVAEKTDG